MMPTADVRRGLRRRVGAQLTPALWNYLVDKQYVSEVSEGILSLDDLAAEARRVLDAGAPTARTADSTMGDPTAVPGHDDRAHALSELVAIVASEDPDVLGFRARHLPGGTMRWDEVGTWIERQAEAAGAPTQYVTVALPSDTEQIRDGRETRFEPPISTVNGYSVETKTLAYAAPGDTWTRHVPTVRGAPLEALRALSESLAKSFAWQPAQACVFVLTGVTPSIGQIRATSGGIYMRNHVDCGWAARITLDIDPAVPASVVARAYRKVRADRGLGRHRTLSAKHARLAVAASDDAKPWVDRHRAWNAEFPHWAYVATSNFRRDARRAQRHLLYPAG
jgi:hypothetical protein